ncbi:MAG: AAA family ATPase [Spiribacter salinus]|uniref:AAA family ATPase n=1 Tax=Spiribacter salinus TaxID=1335746 RepID=A0A540VT39_9GAMM|nr:MAG: AAA family ATPase [Spiribacter salinus]
MGRPRHDVNGLLFRFIRGNAMIGEIPGEPTKEAEEAFLQWLGESRYGSAVDHCPVDGGEYVGADANETDVVGDFLSDHPEYEEDEEDLFHFASNFAPFTTIFKDMDEDHLVPPNPQAHHKLLWLAVVGGWLDGLKMEFSDGLNCIIGGRGTGKTTVLELLRFVLDVGPDENEKESKKKFDALIARNLDFGRVELGIETKERMSYIVTRSAGEDPVVLTADRQPTDLVLRLGSLFKADIFSQNQVEGIADRWDSQLALIDSFDQQGIAGLTAEIRRVVDELAANATTIVPLHSRVTALEEETKERQSIDEQLKGMAAQSGGDASMLSKLHAQKSLRDRETRAAKKLQDDLDQYGFRLREMIGVIGQVPNGTITDEMTGGPNATIFTRIVADFEETGSAVDQELEQTREKLHDLWGKLQQHHSALTAAQGAQEVQYREILEKQQAANAENDKRAKLEKRRNDLLAKEGELKATREKITGLKQKRTELLNQLTELRHQRFATREGIAKRLTESLQGDIRATITQDGRPDLYRQKLEDLLSGSRVQGRDKDKIVDSMWPSDLVENIRTGDVEKLIDQAGIGKSTAEKVVDYLATNENLHELQTVELIDEPKIELNDNGTWKDSRDLSTGQKCTAILPILLMESAKPLLIDQPEDNLDNRYVSDKVVKTIREVKPRRQLVFVTHNPNIPVLGDAEMVFVLDSNGTAGTLTASGSVDACKQQIINLLEGGEKAFEQRSKRYRE